MHQLLGDRRRPPPEVADDVAAVGVGLRGPERHRPRRRNAVGGRPVHLTGPLLHHPEAAPALQTAVEIVVERDQVGVSGPRPAHLLLLRQVALDLTEGIGVPGDEVEALRGPVVVEVPEMHHEVVGHPAPRREPAQDLDLLLLEGDDRVAGEAVEVEHVRGVRLGHRQIWWVDLVPGGVLLAPEDIAPGLVQRLERPVALFQPDAEGVAAGGAVGARRVVAPELVVGLPAGDGRMLPVALGDLGRDAAGVLPVDGAGVVVVLARAEVADVALLPRPAGSPGASGSARPGASPSACTSRSAGRRRPGPAPRRRATPSRTRPRAARSWTTRTRRSART